jgi:hypothetical protein
MRQVLISAILFFCVSMSVRGQATPDSPAKKRSDEAQAKYDAAAQKASDAFWTAMIAADKRAIDDLKVSAKIAKGNETKPIADELAAAQDALAKDEENFKNHSLVRGHGSPFTGATPQNKEEANRVAQNAEAGVATPPEIGISEGDCDSMESARGWTKSIIEDSDEGKTVLYYYREVDGLEDKDLCKFKDGKLVKIKPTRSSEELKHAGPGQAQEVSGMTSFGGLGK